MFSLLFFLDTKFPNVELVCRSRVHLARSRTTPAVLGHIRGLRALRSDHRLACTCLGTLSTRRGALTFSNDERQISQLLSRSCRREVAFVEHNVGWIVVQYAPRNVFVTTIWPNCFLYSHLVQCYTCCSRGSFSVVSAGYCRPSPRSSRRKHIRANLYPIPRLRMVRLREWGR